MRLLSFFVISIISNVIAFLLAAKFIPGVTVTSDLVQLTIAASIYAILNLVLRPILKLILTPIIILTLGLGLILVNALILYILTILTSSIIIQGTITLLYAALLISAVNLIISFAARRSFQSQS